MPSMLRVRAFQGLAPRPDLASKIACVPYDVVNREEAAALAKDNPYSLLHVDRAEIDLPPEIDPYDNLVYATARKNFERMINAGWLEREPAPCLYIYRQHMGNHVQTGVAGLCHVDDYSAGIIRRHEKTRLEKEQDRARLIAALNAQTGPVFLTYRDNAELASLVTSATSIAPVHDFTAEDGVRHVVWKVAEPAKIEEAFRGLAAAYVADGHHRTASAVRVALERQKARGGAPGEEDWFLAVLFPASQLQILPYHRVVTDLAGRTPEQFLEELRKVMQIVPETTPEPAGPGQCSMYLAGRWYGLRWQAEPFASPVDRLDASILQQKVLRPLLGIEDPRTDPRIDFVGGIRGVGELVKRVKSGQASMAFAMSAVTVEQIMETADAGGILPPKSTWFEPKLRSGLFIHTF